MALVEIDAAYDSKNDIITVSAVEEGKMVTENFLKATGIALQLSKKHSCNLILFDVRKMKEAQTLLQGYMDMKDLNQSTGLTPQHKCAIVYNPEKYSKERATFIETVVTNRPNPRLKLFTSSKEAIQWLKAS